MNKEVILEVCVENIQDCQLAQNYGADRIELNSCLYLGGLTPSLGQLILAKEKVNIPVVTMVRPRPGNFVYDSFEKELILKDARLLLNHGADGLVFGALTEEAYLDVDFLKELIGLCQEFEADAVVHRSIDGTADYMGSIEELITLSCNRILTSGQADKVTDGIQTLKVAIEKYGKEIEFCLGSGIKPENIADIARLTGAKQLHGSFSHWIKADRLSRPGVDYSYSPLGDFQRLSVESFNQAIRNLKEVK